MGSKKSTSSNAGGRGSGRKETNRRKKDSATNQTQGATKAVKKAVSFSQTKHPTEGIVDSYTFKDGKKNQMYGGQVSKATNDYLVSIGEAKKTGGGGYMLTSKGWKMKYGSYTAGQAQTGSAMGSGGAGVMSQIPISEKMFESQKKISGLLVGGLSLVAGPVGGTFMRMTAADTFNRKYSSYRDKFDKNMGKSFVARNTGGNKTASNETANLAMGTTEQDTNKKNKKKSTNKNTGRYFAGQYLDESSNKRKFYS
tara:strand:+ start:55 stop:816 length:762 start_codon:yes stop_codon:yes gene_type:complete